MLGMPQHAHDQPYYMHDQQQNIPWLLAYAAVTLHRVYQMQQRMPVVPR
jgi:hypothetical protein